MNSKKIIATTLICSFLATPISVFAKEPTTKVQDNKIINSLNFQRSLGSIQSMDTDYQYYMEVVMTREEALQIKRTLKNISQISNDLGLGVSGATYAASAIKKPKFKEFVGKNLSWAAALTFAFSAAARVSIDEFASEIEGILDSHHTLKLRIEGMPLTDTTTLVYTMSGVD